MRLLLVFIMMVMVGCCDGGIFSWLFKKKTPPSDPAIITPNNNDNNGYNSAADVDTDVAVSAKIPFELKSTDEKFLMEAAAYTSLQMSDLDVCHHKVILGLQKACGELNEEDLSRVAVNLLNCQSVAENRPIFPCTSDMPLSACTSQMDGNSWNAYHIVSNRARAVCYAARQQQFTAHTQMAVNKLMASAQDQIRTMDGLQEGQEALGRVTSDTLESLSSGHKQLQQQQQQLSSSHMAVHSIISSNLRELSREKKLIASGQRELASITETIRHKLDEAKEQLANQEDSQRDVHAMILQDLSTIQDNALKVWQKLDASTQKILLAHEVTVGQYGRVMADLERMNTTVHHLLDLLHSTRAGVENRLAWITSLLGGTDNTLAKVYSITLHAAYFMVAMVAASFLQVPYSTRLALVVLVPLNAAAEVRHETCLPFSTITTILALCIFANLSLSIFWNTFRCKKNPKCVTKGEGANGIIYQPSDVLSPSPTITQVTHHTSIQKSVTDSTHTSHSTGAFNLSGVSLFEAPRTEATGDYSSDEDPPSPEPKHSLLRRRILGRLSTSPKFECVEEVERRIEEEESDVNTTVERESASKTLSEVRRQLLDHLTSPKMNGSSLNLSLNTTMPNRATPSSSRCGTPSKSLTPRRLCASICRTGQPCRNTATGDSPLCYLHARSASRSSTPARASRKSTPVPS
ncbi:hypothetical protein Pmani_026218 [Petrolisthes manimaculis]|uniref:Protein brambleberry n=1 Tax=Petrolisthes manimaculis TaxID=1843537 RepID=A0AAE1P6J1_9EUCA|nr:hypothetical protein Pmani_026218 [Petrolisthes manimaculis]